MAQRSRLLRVESPVSSVGGDCRECSLRFLCLPSVLDREGLMRLQGVVQHPRPYARGRVLVRAGAPLRSLMVVRSGLLRTHRWDASDGRLITGFVLPGEIAGLEAISGGRHRDSITAVDTSSVCLLAYPELEALMRELPALHEHFLRLLSHELARARDMLGLFGRRTARERVASVLVDLVDRQAGRGLSSTQLHLGMTWRDLASYLRLAPPTVSRALHELEADGLLRSRGGEVMLQDPEALRAMAGGAMRRRPERVG